ncbi:YqkE family protein [Pontibacillus litoralis]|uniref:Sulfurtransferase n=1 Tax=Pontibacillus litoralis JSM 072002 TaxID=1385512 RepID=A0A0A5HQZ2_9BACI|nr:YqkE family protein [Pontibacillus litoralis]KGX85992.1 hypothetical protein N784_06370 [Pontibacillus litoralis JSM 072002]
MNKGKERENGTLKDWLQDDVVKQLQAKKSALKQQEKEREEAQERRQAEKRKRREANKSFEELLNDSDLDWKSFKK